MMTAKEAAKDRKRIALKLAALEPKQIDGIEQRTLSMFTMARNIQQQADKQAKQIWRRAVRKRKELP